ncbi:hypothetical protein FRC02_000941 [Tulasnella sp. 418]|nr:hypothetical protein FRC02_000941 [Tulasnella sp. 418]
MQSKFIQCDCRKRFDENSSSYRSHIRKCKSYLKATQHTHEIAKRKAQDDKKLVELEAKRQRLDQSEAASQQSTHASATATTSNDPPPSDSLPYAIPTTSNHPPPSSLPYFRVENAQEQPQISSSRRCPMIQHDVLPEGPGLGPLEIVTAATPLAPETSLPTSSLPSSTLSTPEPVYRSKPNSFGVFREFSHKPHHDPDDGVPLEALTDFPLLSSPPPSTPSASDIQAAIHPYPNVTAWRIGSWYEEARVK